MNSKSTILTKGGFVFDGNTKPNLSDLVILLEYPSNCQFNTGNVALREKDWITSKDIVHIARHCGDAADPHIHELQSLKIKMLYTIWGTWADLRVRGPLPQAQNSTKTHLKFLKFRIPRKTCELERFPARHCRSVEISSAARFRVKKPGVSLVFLESNSYGY